MRRNWSSRSASRARAAVPDRRQRGHPAVHLPAQRRHRAHRQQAVPDLEQLLEELLGVAVVPGGDLPLQRPHLLGERGEVVPQPGRQRRDDGERQLVRGRGAEAAVEQPAGDGAGLDPRGLGGDLRVQRPVHGDEPAGADELVELDVVDVPPGAALRARAARRTGGRGRGAPSAPGCARAQSARGPRVDAEPARRARRRPSSSQAGTSTQTTPRRPRVGEQRVELVGRAPLRTRPR